MTTALTGVSTGFEKGFDDQTNEVSIPSLDVNGAMPAWLAGTLVRNGPARFRLADKTLNHWFDGLAMLHRFDIADGQVSYANKYLDTPAFRAARAGPMKYSEFATDPCRSLFKRIFVARPDATVEDDGVLLTVVLDADNETSYLLVLDAADLTEVARATVPQHIPFGFHGTYVQHAQPAGSPS